MEKQQLLERKMKLKLHSRKKTVFDISKADAAHQCLISGLAEGAIKHVSISAESKPSRAKPSKARQSKVYCAMDGEEGSCNIYEWNIHSSTASVGVEIMRALSTSPSLHTLRLEGEEPGRFTEEEMCELFHGFAENSCPSLTTLSIDIDRLAPTDVMITRTTTIKRPSLSEALLKNRTIESLTIYVCLSMYIPAESSVAELLNPWHGLLSSLRSRDCSIQRLHIRGWLLHSKSLLPFLERDFKALADVLSGENHSITHLELMSPKRIVLPKEFLGVLQKNKRLTSLILSNFDLQMVGGFDVIFHSLASNVSLHSLDLSRCDGSWSIASILDSLQSNGRISDVHYYDTPLVHEKRAIQAQLARNKDNTKRMDALYQKEATKVEATDSGLAGNEANAKRMDAPNPSAVDMVGRVQAVRHLLDMGGRVIVLHGMGGVGKTTLMEAVADVLIEEGGYSNHRVKLQQDPNIPKLQKYLLASLTGKEARVCDFEDGQAQLAEVFERPRENQTLICLDDVWKDEHLDKLLPREISNPSKVKFLITTRNVAVQHAFLSVPRGFESSAIKTYKVDLLSEEMSKALLLQALRIHGHVGISVTSDQSAATGLDMLGLGRKELLAKELLKACNGHPLAIKLVGSYIYRNGDAIYSWEHAIARMSVSDSRENALSDCLDYALESLSVSVKNAFLDIVAFFIDSSSTNRFSKVPRGATWDYVGSVVGSSNLKDLEDRSLVERNVKGGLGEPAVKVHDLLVAMAKRSTPEKSRVTSLTELLEVLRSRNLTELERVEGIFVELSEKQKYNGDVFEGIAQMHSLRILVLEWVGFGEKPDIKFSISSRAHLRALRLPDASWLRSSPWSSTNVRQLSLLWLEFRSGWINGLGKDVADIWFGKEEDMMMKALTMLELHCAPAFVLGNILGKCGHSALTQLTLKWCYGVADALRQPICQQQMWSTSLTHLRLVYCDLLRSLPEYFGKLSSLRELIVRHSSDLEELPEGICGGLKELERIDLWGCRKLRYLPLDLISATSLRRLTINVSIPENIYDVLSDHSKLLHTSLDERTPATAIISANDIGNKVIYEKLLKDRNAGEIRARAAQHLLEYGQLIDDQGMEVPSVAALLKGKVVGLLFLSTYLDEPEIVCLPHEVRSICEQLATENKQVQYVVVRDPFHGKTFLDGQWRAYLPLEPMPKHWVGISMWDSFTRCALSRAYLAVSDPKPEVIIRDKSKFSFVFTVFEEGCMHTAFDALNEFEKWGVKAYPFIEKRLQLLSQTSSKSKNKREA